MKEIKIGITGHRDLADEAFVQEAIANVISHILIQNKAESFEAVSGLAYGADTLFVRIAKEKFNAKINIMLPFSLSEYEKDFDSAERIKELRRWCDLYPPEVLLPLELTSLDRKEKNEAYLNCGKKIVDTCDYLIAVWNGKPSSGESGTQIVVDYARSVQRKIETIWAYKKGDITEKEISDLLVEKDQKAQALKSQYEKYWRWGIVIGILAVYALIIPFCFEMDKYSVFLFSVLETLMVTTLFILTKKVNDKTSMAERLTSRMEAEQLRVLLAFANAKIPVTQPQIHLDDVVVDEAGVITKPNDRLLQIERFLALQSYEGKDQSFSIDAILDLIEKQIEYHMLGNRVQRVLNRLKFECSLAKVLTYIFVAGIIVHLLTASMNVFAGSIDTHLVHLISIFIILGVPPLFAGLELWKYFEEWERYLSDSAVMTHFFQTQKKQLQQHPDQMFFIAYNIREVMYMENSTWKHLMNSKVMHGIT